MVTLWMELVTLNKEIYAPYSKRVLHEYALASNFIHPDHRGQTLNWNDRATAQKFFIERLENPGALDDLRDFKEMRGVFTALNNKKCKPQTFWECAVGADAILVELALKLIQLPMFCSNYKDFKPNFVTGFSNEEGNALTGVFYDLNAI